MVRGCTKGIVVGKSVKYYDSRDIWMWLLKVGSGTVLFCKKAAVIFAGMSEPWFGFAYSPYHM